MMEFTGHKEEMVVFERISVHFFFLASSDKSGTWIGKMEIG